MKSFKHTKSPLKSKLLNKSLSIGSWLTIPHQNVIEILATAGFEWLTIDIEHSAIDIQTVQNKNISIAIIGPGLGKRFDKEIEFLWNTDPILF